MTDPDPLTRPADIASPIVDRLVKGQTIDRGYLGVRIQPMGDDMAESLGLPHNRGELVQAVEPGKAGAQAGILTGDVVISVNGKEITREQSLSFLVANTPPGSRVPVELIRNGQKMTLQATIGKRPTEEELAAETFNPDPRAGGAFGKGAKPAGNLSEKALGLSVLALNPQIARQLGASEDTRGVVLNVVDPSSDAGAKGLQRGDIVLTANYKAVASPAEFDAVVSNAKAANRAAVLLQVLRRGQPPAYVPVRLR